ncbi:hypothetical protein AAG570_005675 [Ranatra chinensis]|uniref:EF-hand domain-containing protein n=1 Tax=Ranatra chinensis TaxID=642074 RepID=A0ABD0YLP5_9HEMI
MASKRRNMFYENKKQETTEIGMDNSGGDFAGGSATRIDDAEACMAAFRALDISGAGALTLRDLEKTLKPMVAGELDRQHLREAFQALRPDCKTGAVGPREFMAAVSDRSQKKVALYQVSSQLSGVDRCKDRMEQRGVALTEEDLQKAVDGALSDSMVSTVEEALAKSGAGVLFTRQELEDIVKTAKRQAIESLKRDTVEHRSGGIRSEEPGEDFRTLMDRHSVYNRSCLDLLSLSNNRHSDDGTAAYPSGEFLNAKQGEFTDETCSEYKPLIVLDFPNREGSIIEHEIGSENDVGHVFRAPKALSSLIVFQRALRQDTFWVQRPFRYSKKNGRKRPHV